uniref:Uncharacterized protein n=1 Tax=Panagrolaimus davidi TaxID=227884 RepID=A0A914PNK6_9BILA
MAEYNPINLPWHNLFEVQDDLNEDLNSEDEDDESMDDSRILDEESFDKNLCVAFFDTCQSQDFLLPKPIILYIIENAGHRVLRKLFASCKYFYAKKQTPICYRLQTGYEEKFINEGLILWEKNGLIKSDLKRCLKKTFIYGSIFINCRDKTVFSTLLPRIYRCEAKFISLYDQSISFDELKFLIEHGGIVTLDLGHSEIKDEKGDYVCLEQIIQFLPNISMLELPKVKVSAKTGHALAEQKFYGKISRFCIAYIFGEPFDDNQFVKFCKTNGDDEHFGIGLHFAPTFDRGFIEKLKETMEDYEESFESANVYIIQYDEE